MTNLISLEQPSQHLFWTAPGSDAGELNTEDPLGLDYVAQQVGLLLLPNLTTRSTRAQAYAVVLYGLRLAEKAVQHYGYPNTDEMKRELFERWERFWALATLEHRDGELSRGDWDAMRGIRGAKAVWRASGDALPLDFTLISRQQQLGHLGAYLAPLRRSKLVNDGTVRPTSGAIEIIDNFWDEESENRKLGQYENYALGALDLDEKTVRRKHNNLTLARVGERTRLTSLVRLQRAAQQRRLYDAIFAQASDATTYRVAQLVEGAVKAGVRAPRAILDEAVDGKLGDVARALHELLVTARAFGDYMFELIRAFDCVYGTVERGGWRVAGQEVVRAAFDADSLGKLRHAAREVLRAPSIDQIRRLPMHGAACLRLAEELQSADGATALGLLLAYHAGVQRERRRGAGWIRDEGESLVLYVTSYTSRPDDPVFPSFKLHAVRTLLTDMGRLPLSSGESAPEEAA